MTVTEIRTKRAVLEDGVDEQPRSDCLLLKDTERSAPVSPGEVAVRNREFLGGGLSAADADDL